MGGSKKSKVKGKSAAKAGAKNSAQTRNLVPDGVIFFSAVCIVFLLLVDTYYIWMLMQLRS